MPDCRPILATAFTDFGLSALSRPRRDEEGRSKRSTEGEAFYIQCPVRKTVNSLPRERYAADATRLFSPVTYLSGIEPPPDELYFLQETRNGASFSLVVGEYGLGKTELMRQVAERLATSEAERPVSCLPIRLGSCAPQLHVLLAPNLAPESFLRALLAHLPLATGEASPAAIEELLGQIRAGAVVLLLDALDELVFEAPEHRQFLENVGGLFRPELPRGAFHIVISVRLEHLKHVSGGNQLSTVRSLQKHAGEDTPVNFLALEFFDDATVNDYILHRMRSDELVRDLPRHRRLRDMLRRPLLLRIFCDIADGPEGWRRRADLLNSLDGIISPAGLLDLFTSQAEKDATLLGDQERLVMPIDEKRRGLVWSNQKIAAVSLAIFRRGRIEFGHDELESMLADDGDGSSRAGRDPAMLERLIYKCPFLRLTSVPADESSETAASPPDLIARFTHRVFFEYFTTRGIVDELADCRAQENGCADPELTGFHDLVLNIDMHRFLRDLTVRRGNMDKRDGEKWWYDETRLAYGLTGKGLGEWVPPYEALEENSLRWHALNQIRENLLDVRSGLKTDAMEIGPWVDDYLKEDKGSLTPRYQIPNYEAVAVCLLDPNVGTEKRHRDFSGMLRKRLDEAIALLQNPAAEVCETEVNELLVERILDIARRFRYPWVQKRKPNHVAAAPVPERRNSIVVRSETGVRDRIRKILVEIGELVF